MKLYLMRHCLADEGAQMDRARPLDDTGRAQAKLMKRALKLAGVDPDIIITSPFVRTRETAEAVQRRDTPIFFTAALEPDGTAPAALQAISALAEDHDAKAVLVITHGPLIQKILAGVAFQFSEHWHWEHGSVAYIHTSESRFRWFMTPKFAAHILGEDPSDFENPFDEADARALVGAGAVILSEHLLTPEKADIIDPLVSQFAAALQARWRRQRTRVVRAITAHADVTATLDYEGLAQFATLAVAAMDDAFHRRGRKVRRAAYAHGAASTGAQLVKPVKPVEAEDPKKKKRFIPPFLPGPDDGYLDELEGDIDNTTKDRVKNRISEAGAGALGLAALLQGIREEFDSWSTPPAGQVSRGETVALGAITEAYHAGAADYTTAWRGGNGPVEKYWSSEPDACEVCLANTEMGWIDSEAPFDSGDFEPQAHPNCRCAVEYRPAEELEESARR